MAAQKAGTSACSPDCNRSRTPVDETVCSSGKHQDKVTEASMTMRFKGAPRGAVHGLSFRRAKGRGPFRSL